MRAAIRLTCSVLWYTLAAVVVIAALTLTFVRFMLPMAAEYRIEVQAALGDLLQRPVRIEAITARWRGAGPAIELRGLELFDPSGDISLLRFERAYAKLDVVASLRQERPVLDKLQLSGVNLRVVRREDRRIVVAGFDTQHTETSPRTEESVIDWLLTQEELAIDNAEVHWSDRGGATAATHFSAVSLRLRNDGDRHRLHANIEMPDVAADGLRIAADFTGRVGEPGSWQGRVYVEGRGFDLARLGTWPVRSTMVSQGRVQFSAWTEWEAGLPKKVESIIEVADLRLDTRVGSRHAGCEQIKGEVVWQRSRQDQWQLDAKRIAVVCNDHAWPETQLQVAAAPGAGEFALRAGYLRIEDVNPLLLASELVDRELAETLAAMRPSGEIHSVYVSYAPAKVGAERFRVHADFTDLSYEGIGKIPSVKGVDGTIRHDGDSGIAELNAQDVELAAGDMFRRPIEADSLSGRAIWYHAHSAWRISADDVRLDHDDLRAEARFDLALPDNGSSPFLDIIMWYEDGKVGHASRYYPVSIMSEEVVDWLDRSLVSGHVVWGALALRGPLRAFPFDEYEGKFEVRFHVADAIIDYAPGWPRAEEVEAEVVLAGRRMDITAVAGKILDADVAHANIAIPEIRDHDAVIEIRGEAHGSASGVVNFLTESPLDESFGNYLLGTRASGKARLELALTVPLSTDQVRVKGELSLTDTLIAKEGWEFELEDVRGVLHFTESRLYARGVRARLLGKPADLDIGTDWVALEGEAGPRKKALVLSIVSRMGVEDIAAGFDHPVLAFASGSAEWRVKVVVPEAEWRERVSARLTLESNLQGVAVDLPAPFAKLATESRRLSVSTELHEDPVGLQSLPQRLVTLRYGKDINAGFILQDTPEGIIVERGEVACGADISNLPDPGVRISGQLPVLDVDEWWAFLGELRRSRGGVAGPAVPTQINGMDLRVGELRVLRRAFADASLTLSSEGPQWLMSVDSDNLSGRVTWQDDIQVAPMVIDFDRVIVLEGPKGNAGGSTEIDPRRLPALQVAAKRVIYRDVDLGPVTLETSRTPSGLKIDSLQAEVAAGRITGSGHWLAVDERQFTRVDVRLDSTSLGKTLAAFGFSGAVAGGETDLELVAQWPGSPVEFSTATLNGTVSMDIRKGQILEVEPGAGRVFGLLSLQTLPRRLALDFSDLFQKGFAFDSVSGEFAIENGNAYTNALIMEGPSAKIDISGRTGLIERDYDQLVTITPKLTGGSLPLAGALFGGPAVGAAILAIEQVFKPAIEEISRYHYTIKGTWEEPLVEPLRKDRADSRPVS